MAYFVFQIIWRNFEVCDEKNKCDEEKDNG